MARIISEKASLVIKDKGLIYNICTLTQFIDGEDISFKFVPNYSVIDLLPDGLFEGIQGLDLDLRKEEYYREGVPTFIYERVPQRNRIDLERYVKASGLDYYNPIAILKEGYKYAGDNIFATKYIDPKEVSR